MIQSPDYPLAPEEIEEAQAVDTLRKVLISNFPDLNVMLNGVILLSSDGLMSICLGTVRPDTFEKVGFKA